MTTTPKTGLEALLRPEDSILVLVDHQPYQFANLHSHEPTMIINNVTALAKLARVFNVPTILASMAVLGQQRLHEATWAGAVAPG